MQRAFFLFLVLALAAIATSTQRAKRDPQAQLALQQSMRAMGGQLPADMTATGTVVLAEGPDPQSGTVRILAKGYDRMVEEITVADGTRRTVYSGGLASRGDNTETKVTSLESAVSSRTPFIPLLFFGTVLSEADSAWEVVGEEDLEGTAALHLRVSKTFAANPKLVVLAELSTRDIWLHKGTGLPLKIAYEQREGRAAVPRILVEIRFSDYRNVTGILIPFQITKSMNGTEWLTIRFDRVAINTGLTDASFAIRQETRP